MWPVSPACLVWLATPSQGRDLLFAKVRTRPARLWDSCSKTNRGLFLKYRFQWMCTSYPQWKMTQLGDVLFDLGISRDTLNRPCSEAHANEISLHIVNWESLSPFLGLKETDEEDIRHSGNRAAQRIALLRRWRQTWGFKATYLRLAEAFAQIGNRELVERLCKLVTKGSVEVVGATSPSTETQSAGMPKLCKHIIWAIERVCLFWYSEVCSNFSSQGITLFVPVSHHFIEFRSQPSIVGRITDLLVQNSICRTRICLAPPISQQLAVMHSHRI